MLLRALTLALLALLATGVPAQTQKRSTPVYRCGPDGRDLRDAPCPGQPPAAASAVEFDQPSAADSQAARQRQLADAKRAAALAQERQKQEAEARAQRRAAVGLIAASAPEPASHPASHPPQDAESAEGPEGRPGSQACAAQPAGHAGARCCPLQARAGREPAPIESAAVGARQARLGAAVQRESGGRATPWQTQPELSPQR